MSDVVVDASIALAWCFPDEASDYADRVLLALAGHTILVPAAWSLEVTNGLLIGERRKRLKPPEVSRFLALLEGLSIAEEGHAVTDTVNQVLPVARDCGLSAYDAAYLELALRRNAPLATLDSNLEKAAKRLRVPRFP